MSISFVQFFAATVERQPELVLQMPKIAEFSAYVGQLLLQAAPHRCARLEAIPSKPEETPDFAEFES